MSDLRKSVTHTCVKHGKYAGEIIRMEYPGMRPVELPPMCPICEREEEAEKKRREEESRKLLAVKKWRGMNIEPRFYGASFGGFNAYNAELHGYLETCRAFAKKPDGNLVMLGENGNGKTHLAVCVLKAVGGVIYTAYEIGLMLRRSYKGETMEWEVFHELCTAPLLVMDEVEKIKDSESKHNWFSYVVGKRYDRLLPTVFIANCHTQKNCREQKKPCPRCLEYHLENDILSRIIETGTVMTFSSGDYREKTRDARLGRGK